jgi:perosamine synthetase
MNKSTALIPHSRPWITAADSRAVARAVRSGLLAQGAEVAAFEQEVGEMFALPPGVATSSGTAALHLALIGLGIGPGDEVILPSYVCVSPLLAIQYVGATPRLADVDPATFNLDPTDVRRRLTRRTRAIIVPHLFGLPADLSELLRCGVPLVEDCAQALGAAYRGRPVGTHGAVAIASFYATKLLTTGEGGMVLSRDHRILAHLRDLRDYDERPRHALRYNYKLTDFQAALGRSQFRRFPAMLRQRQAIADRYRRAWRDLPVELPTPVQDCIPVYHRFVLRVPGSAQTTTARLLPQGVTARRPVFRPLHRLLGLDGYPGSEQAHRRAVSVPIYPGLTRLEEGRVVSALRSVLA